MCLFSQNIIPLKADKPIACYKVFEEVYCSLNASCAARMILTPYMAQLVTRDEFDGKEPMRPDTIVNTKRRRTFTGYVRPQTIAPYIMIESGIIHAYLSKDAAVATMKDYFAKLSNMETVKHCGDTFILSRFILCECEIPAGTEYYKGGDEPLQIEAEECCGAEQIIIKKVIAEAKEGKVKTL